MQCVTSNYWFNFGDDLVTPYVRVRIRAVLAELKRSLQVLLLEIGLFFFKT